MRLYFQDLQGEDRIATAMSVVWNIDKGNFGSEKFDRLKFAMIIFSKGNPLKGVDDTVLHLLLACLYMSFSKSVVVAVLAYKEEIQAQDFCS